MKIAAAAFTQLSLGFNAYLTAYLHGLPGAIVIESDADKAAHPDWQANPVS